jgi:hypothetical protein
MLQALTGLRVELPDKAGRVCLGGCCQKEKPHSPKHLQTRPPSAYPVSQGGTGKPADSVGAGFARKKSRTAQNTDKPAPPVRIP